MLVVSVNLAGPVLLDGRQTGIFKSTISGTVPLNPLGLTGDSVCDRRHHGGPDQAVYVYGRIDYDWWESKLNRTLAPGTFGDNLTVAGLSCQDMNIGDHLEIGEVVLEVSAPRIPCSTLGKKMKDATFLEQFRHAERPGVYCRVLNSGDVAAGMPVRLKKRQSDHHDVYVPLLTLFRAHYEPFLAPELVSTLLAAPIAVRERNRLLKLTTSA